MYYTTNEINNMFIEHAENIHALKHENDTFSSIFDEYHDVTREIHRGETNVEPMDDFRMEELRKRRLTMLDRVAAILK